MLDSNNKVLLQLKEELSKEKKEDKGNHAKFTKVDNYYRVNLPQGKKSIITNETKVNDKKFSSKSFPVCNCEDHKDIVNSTIAYCDGKICTCVHDNKHRIQHCLMVGLVKINPKGFGFIEQSSMNVYLPHYEANRVLNLCTVSYVASENEKGKVAHIKTIINHPYTRYPAEVVSLSPLKVTLKDDPLKKAYLISSISDEVKSQLKVGSIVLITIDDINAIIEGRSQTFEVKVDDYVGEKNEQLIMWYEELAKYELPRTDETCDVIEDPHQDVRKDLTAIPFISIDSATTNDVDDVIYVHQMSDADSLLLSTDNNDQLKLYSPRTTNICKYNFAESCGLNQADLNVPEGTKTILAVGIADPSAFFAKDSLAETRAKKLMQTFYLPAYTLNMLPNNITLASSLLEEASRPSIVGFIYFDEEANFNGVEFRIAKISNKAKLTYEEVSSYLEGARDNADYFVGHALASPKIKEVINSLEYFFNSRGDWRIKNSRQVTYTTSNTEYIIDDSGKCLDIIPVELSSSHELVSECMLCFNSYIASYFKHFEIPGIYNYQSGFKPANINYFKDYINFLVTNKGIKDLEPYTTLLKDVTQSNEITLDVYHQIKEICLANNKVFNSRILRFMSGSEFSFESNEHYGLGLEAYANGTSPIRRYVDIVNQRLLKDFICDKPLVKAPADILEQLTEAKTVSRNINKKIATVLESQYLLDRTKQEFTVEITAVMSSFICVKDLKSSIAGVIYTNFAEKELGKKIVANPNAMEFEVDNKIYTLGDKLKVCLQKVDKERVVFNFVSFVE
ncbi:hypothetical protein CKF54_07625 [Psittacicella hinzii]|uniref:RNB domain-containing protein n=1 Tax=Psittacicella hinzii TaxID=2028575 RepID=A0A3A1Y1E8_9GAMM|nr:RNB domain-containing ribonuclease [Psittacicella hinzii]RIY31106.1 hypothetical protein CKF54_07625 [Psittacicella hinzii]